MNITHQHAAINGFAHVINGQQRNLHSGQGFHFDPGLSPGLGTSSTFNTVVRPVNLEIHRDIGECQRVAIARAVVKKPPLILADEPTASLDDDNARIVINMLKEQAERYQASLIIATHDQRVKDQFELQLNLDTP